ncbi:hypothetical protein H6G89_31905 [Oscillatoria sp. FACHB-1407]|uniref:hypothetical protein n=1 Tax=Oscillatoria sp. FACHB-1407 TaxID=2692847 RepID=UPI0016888BA0|nr:hypothetical protein [Oscillatoria sp. FACHB-1407]MBD2465600.1 hypothetical protein [Oscillatoria sp. FACHB-1407]
MKKSPIPVPILLSGVAAISVGGLMGYSRATSSLGSVRTTSAATLNSIQPHPEVSSPTTSEVVPSPPTPLAQPPPEQPTYYTRQVKTCAGRESNANFRAYPSLDPRSIVGVVAYGDSVNFTGLTIQSDGVVWYEVIAPVLYPSLDALVPPRTEPEQKGWIASCFVEN